ncbi:MAG: iron chelate uptake ABC transporter family permease subunit [Firmicutes bacterium]|nr:iron chelate uptake ABC transporter family permease subunit [Bacillota bacterium]
MWNFNEIYYCYRDTDVIARTLFQPMEIPVGIITAALGAPFFSLILYKKKK